MRPKAIVLSQAQYRALLKRGAPSKATARAAELLAHNERLEAVNADLASVNEELESVNEELYAVNAEYQAKLLELDQLQKDVQDLLVVMDAGVLFLDESLSIIRLNDAAMRALPVSRDQLGRPLPEVLVDPTYVRLLEVAYGVLANGERRLLISAGLYGRRWIFDARRVRRVGTATSFGIIVTMREAPDFRRDGRLGKTPGEAHRALFQIIERPMLDFDPGV